MSGPILSEMTRTGQGKFPNPFFDIASEYVPTDLTTIFELCEFMWVTFGTYKAASRRIVSYFITDPVMEGNSDSEREDIEDFLTNTLHIKSRIRDAGEEFMMYGNGFISVSFPFDRFLECPQCNTYYRDSKIPYKLAARRSNKDSEAVEFRASCLKCSHKGAFTPHDIRSPDRNRVNIVRWDPKTIFLKWHPVSGDYEYYWRIPPWLIDRVKTRQDHFYISNTPLSMLRCMFRDDTQPLYHFNKDSVYHMKENYLSGLPIHGWGIPPILANFKLAYYIQVLRRYDEALAFDYIIPFRILYPESGPAPNDGILNQNLGVVRERLASMVNERRRDPTSIQIAPFKIGYQMAGGEGKALSPKESLAFAIDELLNACGYPAELYKGTLTAQAAPLALRLFENVWTSLVDCNNDLLNWIVKKVARHYGWGAITAKFRSVTLADDIERKALALQAAAGMDLSKSTAYRPFGIDYMEEQRRVVEEQQAIQQLQQEAMEEQQAQQGMDGGSSGGGAAEQVGATPGDVQEQAKQTAQQLLLQTPESMRRGELIKIKQSNPTLHALVIQAMNDMRQDMARQGGAQMMEQAKTDMQGQGGGMVAQASAWPSVFVIDGLVAGEVLGYTRTELKKIAMDIKHGTKGAKEAFHFIYEKRNVM